MKTIDEAMTLVCASVKDASEAESKLNAMTDMIEKRQSVADDIGTNPTVINFVNTYVAEVGPMLDFNVHALAMSLFINGVLIGMEMERQEL